MAILEQEIKFCLHTPSDSVTTNGKMGENSKENGYENSLLSPAVLLFFPVRTTVTVQQCSASDNFVTPKNYNTDDLSIERRYARNCSQISQINDQRFSLVSNFYQKPCRWWNKKFCTKVMCTVATPYLFSILGFRQ